jgi:hypothetical protein
MADQELIGDLITGVDVLSDGRFVVAGASGRDGVLMFSRDGTFDSMIGRPGRGPGEVTGVSGVKVGSADTVLVFSVGRVSLFDSQGRYVREAATPWLTAPHAVKLGRDGRTMYSSWIRTPVQAGFQFHRLDDAFRPAMSFGEVSAASRAACPVCFTPRTTWSNARPSHFWAVAPNRYEIDLWQEDGQLVERLVVNSPWFTPWENEASAGRQAGRGLLTVPEGRMSMVSPASEPPRPVLVGIAEDSLGYLWVVARVAAVDWKPFGRPPPTVPDDRYTREFMQYTRSSMDTIIEIVDPVRHVVVARTRVRNQGLLPLSAGVFWSSREDASGLVQVQIHTVILRGPTPTGR